MTFDPLSTRSEKADDAPLPERLLWMIAYWAMGVLVIGTVGFFIRLWIKS